MAIVLEPSALKNNPSPPEHLHGNDFRTEREQARDPRTSFLKTNHGAWLEPSLALRSVHSELVKSALDSPEFWKIHQRDPRRAPNVCCCPSGPGRPCPSSHGCDQHQGIFLAHWARGGPPPHPSPVQTSVFHPPPTLIPYDVSVQRLPLSPQRAEPPAQPGWRSAWQPQMGPPGGSVCSHHPAP